MRWIVFDYGEVISKRTRALPDLAGLLGADPIAFEVAYWAHRVQYDRGIPDLDYWRAVGEQVGTHVDEETSAQLTKTDTAGWMETDPSTVELLAEIQAAGAGLALLSNAPTSFGRAVLADAPWTGHFTHLLFSGDLGVVKPDAEIWAALLDRLGARADDCVFFDDRQVNIDGAIASGLSARLWSTAAEARSHLAALGVL
jgi:putative hydrolase of the HAD superfamily